LSDGELESLAGIATSDTSDAEKLLLDRDLADKLLSRLGGEDRALLQMLYADDMSVAEIAQLTGWSQSKVKIKAWRARNLLRRVLKKFV
jgi:RNA polymerase sigma-70 factor (ECF subfamily)